MRKLIFISLLFVSSIVVGQVPVSRVVKSQVDSSFLPPVRDTTIPGTRAGELRMRPGDNTLYLWNGTKWQASAFDVSNLIPNRPKMRLAACVIQPTIVGSVMSWSFILNSQHDSIFFSNVASNASTINVRFNSAAGKVISCAVTPDEKLAAAGITMGASVQVDSMIISIYKPVGIKGTTLVGNGTAYVATGGNSLHSWTYSTANGSLLLQPNPLSAYTANAFSVDYVGRNGYKAYQYFTGLSGNTVAYGFTDFFMNAVLTNPTSTDIINISAGDMFISTINPSSSGGNGYEANVFTLFSNIWIIALIELP